MIGWDEARQLAEVDVKNRFAIGDRIEIIHPSGNQELRIERMESADGHPLTVAPGNGHHVDRPAGGFARRATGALRSKSNCFVTVHHGRPSVHRYFLARFRSSRAGCACRRRADCAASRSAPDPAYRFAHRQAASESRYRSSDLAGRSDFGFVVVDAVHIDLPATGEAYRAAHTGWNERVVAEATFLSNLAPDLVLTDAGLSAARWCR